MGKMAFREDNLVKWFGTRPAHKGEQVAEHAAATDATVIIYTVPVGKTFFLCSSLLKTNSNTTGLIVLYINNAAPAFRYDLGAIRGIVDLPVHSVNSNFWPPLELPAGYIAVLFSSAVGLTAEGSLFGWVE